MGEETIWSLSIDGSSAVATLDEIGAGLDALIEQFAAVGGAAGDLTAVDDALTALGSTSADSTAEVDGLNEALSAMSSTIAEDTAIIDGLNEKIANLEAQLFALTGEFADSGESAGLFATLLGGAGDAAAAVGDALTAAQGPLLMISLAGVMAGKSLYDAGTQGQQGIELIQGMAGATNQDVQNLEASALSLGDTMQEATAGFYQVASAGYTGADATKVFTAATEAAKGAQTSLQPVSTALTSIMAAYNENADQAKTTTDQMTEAVFVGKQSFDAFASAIGPLAATGHNVGLSFAEVAAAEATMTQINPNVRQDTMQLNSLFTNMDMSMDKVANTAKGLNLNFSETHYASLNLIDKLQYLADVSGGTNTVAFQKMVGGVNGVKAALALLSNQGNTYTGDLQKIQNSQGATDDKFKQSQQTISSHMDKVGAAFSLFSTKFMDALGPKLIPILDALSSNIGKFADFLTSHMDIVMPVLAGLAAMFGAIIVGAIAAFIISIGTVAGIVLGVAAAIGLLVGGIVALVMHWGDITKAFSNFVGGIGAKVTGWFDAFAHKVSDATQNASDKAQQHTLEMKDNVLKNAIDTENQSIQRFDMMRQGILEQLKQTKDGAEKHALEIKLAETTHAEQAAIDVKNKHVKMRQDTESELDKLKKSASDKFGSIGKDIQTIVGSVVKWLGDKWKDTVNAVVGSFEWLYNHNYYFKDLVDTIQKVIKGVTDWLKGAWETVKNDASATWNWLVSKATWLWDQISAPFRNAWSQYIGPALTSLWNSVTSAWNGFVSQAENFGENVINAIANGIKAAAANVSKAASDVAGDIAKFLGFHSPAEEGPGREADVWGPNFVDMFASGIESRQDHLRAALQGVAGTLASSFNPQISGTLNVATATPAPQGAGSDQGVVYLAQIAASLNTLVQRGGQGGQGVTMNNTIAPGTQSAQLLNQFIQSLSGYGYEGTQRGTGGSW